MYDYIKALQHLHLSTNCGTDVVIDIGDRIRSADDQVGEAAKIIRGLTGLSTVEVSQDKHLARLTAQYLGDIVFKLKDVFKPESGYAAAVTKATKYRYDPANSYHFTDMTPGSTTHVETKSVGGVDVEVKANGKVKKGGNAIVAMQLYVDNVIGKQMEIKAFIQLLQDTLNMSKAGATTYAYATRKKYAESKDTK